VTADRPRLLEIAGLVKQHVGPVPLRIANLTIGEGDRVTLSGLDAYAAEIFMHLITGASVPDEGAVVVAGHDTRSIATDTEWLSSLDRFGIVTLRAVLLEKMTIAANLALPLTVAIDPLSATTRAEVEALAREVGLPQARLDQEAASLSAVERVRVHLARALALAPRLLLLEHPTAGIKDQAASADLGATLRRAADARGLGWILMSDDRGLTRAAGAPRFTLDPETGRLQRARFWERWR
jgi:ABC-type lipoprotein export system ATPase subunit